ncbi:MULTISPECIES: FAD-dependent oxidoreductase [Rhodopseudomonas]|uniref:NADH-ubiquinone oxidoreductase subunit 6 n=1 Tax=Rhodopseudomonas palustris TaxID=1076 RepID=A0A0D7EFK5_RHOPL|nr:MULTISPECIES: FAD-dependent oxidoreductase [Rhodopseudomonas]KIZ39523.1 NADH-ubiquinone oxidoreductase subunit 6 [Rhodopseudomonas palustris]MDF3813680.1 FAD-dependent oxidoreductase [Rhodopseudomonas sp. BAL398]WOK18810.1 FAD-dependent oxidoreductase [Rhodopseudomonas sp. BAL398]
MRVAVVGTGIAGNAAAWALSRRYPVTLYERELRPGGHSHTVTVDYDGIPIAVDIGFIVYNEHNYPDLTALFAHLGVETVASCMSFAVSADAGRFEWKGGGSTWFDTAKGLFAQPRNLLSPSYLRMLRDILRFNERSVADFAAGRLAGLTLGDYFALRQFAPRLLTDYLAPMGAAIWSAPADRILEFPAENFIAFFNNHRLLHYDRPVWRSVKGGSQRYVEKLIAGNKERLRLGCAVTAVERTKQSVIVSDSHGNRETYDHVVIAAHSDQALAMLADPSDDERGILGDIGYAPNQVYLHRDPRLMPKRKGAWASWNFLRWRRDGTPLNDVAVTYWMNRLQGIDDARPLFVSLNPPFAPDPALTFGQYRFDHPHYTAAAFAAQKRLGEIQGQHNTWFCGAWTGYGFHEDGLRSGLAVAQALGAPVPWRGPPPEFAQAAE